MPTQNGLKQGNTSSPLFLNFALEYAIRKCTYMFIMHAILGAMQDLFFLVNGGGGHTYLWQEGQAISLFKEVPVEQKYNEK
jgi:hypothetical protein